MGDALCLGSRYVSAHDRLRAPMRPVADFGASGVGPWTMQFTPSRRISRSGMPDSPFFLVAAALGVLGLVLLVVAVRALTGKRWVGSLGSGGTGALFLSLAALAATLGVSTQGYRALTLEEVAAVVTTVPTGEREFQAFVEFPDGRDTTFHV
ncbi:MAG: hypothetical protein EA350_13415, partial [Gemmatimonadales bacterium]